MCYQPPETDIVSHLVSTYVETLQYWIAFMIQPKREKMVVLDSADFALSRYVEFVSILNMLAKLLSYTWTSC